MSYQGYLQYRRAQLRIAAAQDVARITGLDYAWVLQQFEKHDVFGNWSMWETYHRPVNIEELAWLVTEEVHDGIY